MYGEIPATVMTLLPTPWGPTRDTNRFWWMFLMSSCMLT